MTIPGPRSTLVVQHHAGMPWWVWVLIVLVGIVLFLGFGDPADD